VPLWRTSYIPSLHVSPTVRRKTAQGLKLLWVVNRPFGGYFIFFVCSAWAPTATPTVAVGSSPFRNVAFSFFQPCFSLPSPPKPRPYAEGCYPHFVQGLTCPAPFFLTDLFCFCVQSPGAPRGRRPFLPCVLSPPLCSPP